MIAHEGAPTLDSDAIGRYFRAVLVHLPEVERCALLANELAETICECSQTVDDAMNTVAVTGEMMRDHVEMHFGIRDKMRESYGKKKKDGKKKKGTVRS